MAKNTKDSVKSNNYVTTIREGAIAANIFRGVTPDGHAYLYFSLSRSWKSANGNREGYSDRFYERNCESLQNVVTQAATWIQQNPNAADAIPDTARASAAA
ncbi:hypothetical protein [Aeoliella sp.]|uniref:hypothetical protein n=1 Tax=Aeoliella sp. TaxID=2795800 RepID=UPI003CCBD8CC